MNYQWHYDRLISTRRERILEDQAYYEKHHILPRSMGGSDDLENIVHLTAREHFLAHWLLWRIHKNKHTAYAFLGMCNWNRSKYICSSRLYAEAREAAKNNQYIRTDEIKKKISNSRIAHETRWLMSLPEEKALDRIRDYHQKISEGVKKYHEERDKKTSRYSEEGKKRLNKAKLGTHLSEEAKEKIRISSRKKGRKLKVVSCPYCGQEGKGGNMTRYHFEKCKK